MIPKIIHYIWLGGGKLPRKTRKYIKTWKKYCGDYIFMEWNEKNTNLNINKFVSEAYKAKKYAFCSDYIRLYVLYRYGGFYLDTDIEIIRSIDNFLDYELIMGFEDNKYVNGAFIGANKENIHIRNLKSVYDNKHFDINNLETIPVVMTKYFTKIGLKDDGRTQCFNNMKFCSLDYFYPKNIITGDLHLTSNSYLIHHWDASWAGKQAIKNRKKYQFFLKHKKIKKIYELLKRIKNKLVK